MVYVIGGGGCMRECCTNENVCRNMCVYVHAHAYAYAYVHMCVYVYMHVYVHAYAYVHMFVYVQLYEYTLQTRNAHLAPSEHTMHTISTPSAQSSLLLQLSSILPTRRRMGRVYNIKTIQKNSIDTQRNGEGIQKKKSIATKTDGGGGSQKTTVKKPAKKQKRTKSTSGVGAAVLQRGWLGGVLRLVAV